MSQVLQHQTMIKLHTQTGAGLIVFFMVLILAGTVYFLVQPRDDGRVSGQMSNKKALATAKAALLSYASSYYLRESLSGNSHAGLHGLLPCPEQSGSAAEGRESGVCGNEHTNALGRLPWKSLDIAPIKDASGECLWYAVSGGFFRDPKSPMTNEDTPGMFQIFNADGNLIYGSQPENRVVAVVIAPGSTLAGQSRIRASSQLPCRVARNAVQASDYLDNFMGINNAFVDMANPDQIDSFITATGLTDTPQLNDHIITITSDEIFRTIKASTDLYADKVEQHAIELGSCFSQIALSAFIASGGSGNPTCNTCITDCMNTFNICDTSATTDKEKDKCQKDLKKCNKGCTKPCSENGGADPKGKGKGADKGKGKGKDKPKGGGGGGGQFMLPWPAAMNLAGQYRLDDRYDDIDAAANGHFGRLPFIIDDSAGAMGIADNDIFDTCGIDLLSTPEDARLWRDLKDHWFYVVGKDYAPAGTNTNPCIQCPIVNGTAYAAVLIYSGERLNGQLRRSAETETPAPALAVSKDNHTNYLEGFNASNYPDTDGNKTYGINNQNDRLFCLPIDMSDTFECTP